MRVSEMKFQNKHNLLQEYGQILQGTRSRFGNSVIGDTYIERRENTLYLFYLVFRVVNQIESFEKAKEKAAELEKKYQLDSLLRCGYLKIATTTDIFTTTSTETVLYIVYHDLDVEQDVEAILQYLLNTTNGNRFKGRIRYELERLQEVKRKRGLS